MDPENIDWGSIESVFVEDETYENFEAPKWVDLSSPDELIGDEAWFCGPGRTHIFVTPFDLFTEYSFFLGGQNSALFMFTL